MKLIRSHRPFFYSNPFAEIDRLFERDFAGLLPTDDNGPVVPKADFYSDDENYHLRVELPGVGKEELNLETRGSVLTLDARRTAEEGSFEESFHYRREFRLPEEVDVAKTSAKLENGVLQVTLPKVENHHRTIEIK